MLNASPAVNWRDHNSFPESRSNATNASLVRAAGSENESPVEMYTAFRFTSIVGDDHTPAPDGPHNCVPTEFFRTGFASSEIVYDFQIRFPVAASSAVRLPRNLQHS